MLVLTWCQIESNLSGGFSLFLVTESHMGPMAPMLWTHFHHISRSPKYLGNTSCQVSGDQPGWNQLDDGNGCIEMYNIFIILILFG